MANRLPCQNYQPLARYVSVRLWIATRRTRCMSAIGLALWSRWLQQRPCRLINRQKNIGRPRLYYCHQRTLVCFDECASWLAPNQSDITRPQIAASNMVVTVGTILVGFPRNVWHGISDHRRRRPTLTQMWGSGESILDYLSNALRAALTSPERRRAYDPRSLPVFALLACALGIELVVLWASDFYLGRSRLVRQFFWFLLLLMLAMFVRRRHLPRIALLLEALAVPGIAAGLGVTGTVFLAAVSGPFVDQALDRADQALGFDFLALLQFYRDHPQIATASRFAYLSFAIQAALVPPLLALEGDGQRMWTFLTAWCLSLAIVVLIFPFAPAAGPYALHGVTEDVFENFKQLFPWQTGPAIEALRDGSMRDIGAAARGFVSIPSFHAVGGVLFAWAAWRSRWFRWPVLLLNLALIASTIVTGAHYLVDVIAGIALAIPVLLASTQIVRRLESRGSND